MDTLAPNPLISGFNPDPSIVCVDGVFYLITSTFEYMPGIPIYRSTDLVSWTHIGNVATRTEQTRVTKVATNTGVFAPTIRHHKGKFYVIVTVVMSPVACVVFTATDPVGPWSDGTTLQGLMGIDPDVAWDQDDNAYVTYSAMMPASAQHPIQQVRVNLETGKLLEPPRTLWSGTGLKFPEAPHLYQRGRWWYLMIAEGGTERGHAVSVARSRSPEGPFEGDPQNPVLSARSTSRPIQNTGHADLVDLPGGGSALVLLGMRPLGANQSFSPLGRETFITAVDWVDEWPRPKPVELAPRPDPEELRFDFSNAATLEDPGWLAVRVPPADVATVVDGRLVITSGGADLTSQHPRFLGRRQRHLTASLATSIDASQGTGGLAVRYSEAHWFCLEARADKGGTAVRAVAHLSGMEQVWATHVPESPVELRIDMAPQPSGISRNMMNGDDIRLSVAQGAQQTLLAKLDGRYWSAETCTSFTGRVFGLFAKNGKVEFDYLHYLGE